MAFPINFTLRVYIDSMSEYSFHIASIWNERNYWRIFSLFRPSMDHLVNNIADMKIVKM